MPELFTNWNYCPVNLRGIARKPLTADFTGVKGCLRFERKWRFAVAWVSQHAVIMNLGKTLFAQIMDFLPWKTFHRMVARYRPIIGCAASVAPSNFA